MYEYSVRVKFVWNYGYTINTCIIFLSQLVSTVPVQDHTVVHTACPLLTVQLASIGVVPLTPLFQSYPLAQVIDTVKPMLIDWFA